MKRFLTAATLVLMLVALRSPVLAEEDDYDEMQAHPLVLAYYVLHPVGYAAEWLVTRPFHYIVSRPSLERMFGHVSHEEIGLYHDRPIASQARWQPAPSLYARKDAFYTRAKTSGYRARSAYKLLELQRRVRLFKRGDRVVDLGAWPGGWLQVAAECVGASGCVVGVDLQPIDPLPTPTVRTLVGDITDSTTQAEIIARCGGPVDVVLSDLAPKLSGVRARDEAQAEALADCVLDVCGRILKPGGSLVIKLFTRPDLTEMQGRLRALFRSVRLTRPAATRKGSAEVYAVARGYRGVDLSP